MKSYPPFLDKIIERCPKAAFLYTKIWRDRDDNYSVCYTKDKIVNEEVIYWKKFKHDLNLLKKEKVLKYFFNSNETEVSIFLNVNAEGNEKVA